MIYGTIGVPLALIVLADMGRHFTVLLKVLWVLARKSCDVGACICRVSASAAASAGGAVVSAGRRKISRDRKPPYKITDRFENEDGSAPIAQWEDSRTPVSENTEEDEFDDQDGGMFGSGFLRISGKTPTLADIDDQFNLPMGEYITCLCVCACVYKYLYVRARACVCRKKGGKKGHIGNSCMPFCQLD